MLPEEEDRPRLVSLEPRPVTLEDGTQAVALRDPTGTSDAVAVVSPAAFLVLAHLDGTRTLPEVREALRARGHHVPLAQIETLARKLKESGLVHGPVYQARLRRALAEYRAAPARPPSCAGGAYPQEPDELRRMLDGFYTHREGPGGPPRPREARDLRLLVSPHIDYHRGGPSYAHAWRALAEGCDADLFVIFGTAHASPPHLFTLTSQSYDTPLGQVPTDRSLVRALVGELGEDELLADELCHRQEHSIELQMVWLRHVFPDRPLQALPVLCSSISHLDDPGPSTAPFLDALGRAVAGRRVCYVAGADLAHVGPQFGDTAPPTPQELEALAAMDRHTLEFLSTSDPAAFHRDAIRDDDRRRLCGVAPIYAAMRASGAGARLLHYGQWSDGTDSVSFAAAAG
jgi:MEMO1 family protein